jgi:hypothetical protein
MKTNLKLMHKKKEITCLQELMRTGRIKQEEGVKEKGIIKIKESETDEKSWKGMKTEIIKCHRKEEYYRHRLRIRELYDISLIGLHFLLDFTAPLDI